MDKHVTMSAATEKSPHRGRAATALLELLQEVGIFALIGLVGAVLLLLLFAKLSEEVFTQEITSLDNNIALWVHGFASPTLDTIFNAFSTLGGAVGVSVLTLLAFGLLLWRGFPRAAWRFAIAVGGGLAINQMLKMVFHRARPQLWPGAHVAGFSFPSGHATLALCLFGMFAWLGWQFIRGSAARTTWMLLMALLIGIIGLSRVYLGAHYPSDVVAGYLSGSFWLLGLLSGTDIYHRLRHDRIATGQRQ